MDGNIPDTIRKQALLSQFSDEELLQELVDRGDREVKGLFQETERRLDSILIDYPSNACADDIHNTTGYCQFCGKVAS